MLRILHILSLCKTNHQNLVQFWKSYYGPNISQTTAAKLLCFLYVFKTIEKERNLMLVKDLITLLKEYDDDTRVALPIHNSSNYSETIAHDYGDVLVLEGSRQ